MISIRIRKCTCCGREFPTGVFGSRCSRCQDSGHYTSAGFVGTRHKPCRKGEYSDWITTQEPAAEQATAGELKG